jgi:hypothetical protein
MVVAILFKRCKVIVILRGDPGKPFQAAALEAFACKRGKGRGVAFNPEIASCACCQCILDALSAPALPYY